MILVRKVVFYIIYLGLVAALVLAIIISFNSSSGHHNHKNAPSTSQSRGNNKPKTNASPGAVVPKSGTSSPTTGTNGTPTNTVPGQSQNLTNTGPGDVAALFIGSTVLFTLLHWRVKSRKLY